MRGENWYNENDANVHGIVINDKKIVECDKSYNMEYCGFTDDEASRIILILKKREKENDETN